MVLQRNVTLCGRHLDASGHICAFFDSRDQQYDALLPYYREGLANGEQVITILDEDRLDDHNSRIEAAGIPLQEAAAANRLKIFSANETYLKEGGFAAERMYALLERALIEANTDGFRAVRTSGEMSWALRNMPGTDQLMEYEARVNRLTEKYDCTLICVYDVSKINGRAVMDVLSTHPQVLMGDTIFENPYYVSPIAFLKGLIQRGGSALARQDASASSESE
jgi:hypothetical protein